MDRDTGERPIEEPGINEEESLDRRAFLLGLKKWSKIVIGGVLLGSVLTHSGVETDAEAAGWANRGGGGGGAWANRGGGGGGAWANHGGGGGGAWVNGGGGGGAWANRGAAWANGGGSWINGGGVWANRGAAWANRGGSWVNRF